MNRVVKILMERDLMDRHMAENRLKEVRQMIMETDLQSYGEVEDIIADELGLEMDYLLDII